MNPGAVNWAPRGADEALDAEQAIDVGATVRELLQSPTCQPDLSGEGSAAIVVGRVRGTGGKRDVKFFLTLLPDVGRVELVANQRRRPEIGSFVRAVGTKTTRLTGLPSVSFEGASLELCVVPWFSGARGADPHGVARAEALTASFARLPPTLGTSAPPPGVATAVSAGASDGPTAPATSSPDVARGAAYADVVTSPTGANPPAAHAPAAHARAPIVSPTTTPPAIRGVPESLFVDFTSKSGVTLTAKLAAGKFVRRGLDVAWAVDGPNHASGVDCVDLFAMIEDATTSDAPDGPMIFLARATLARRVLYAVIGDATLRLIEHTSAQDNTWRKAYTDFLDSKTKFEVATSSATANLAVFLYIPGRGAGRRPRDAEALALRQACQGRTRAEEARTLALVVPRRLGTVGLDGNQVFSAPTGRFDAFAATVPYGGQPPRVAGRTLGEVVHNQPQYVGRRVKLPAAGEQAAYTTQADREGATEFPQSACLQGVLQWICGLRDGVPSGRVERRDLPDVSNIRTIEVAWARRTLEFLTRWGVGGVGEGAGCWESCRRPSHPAHASPSRCKLVPEHIPGLHATSASFDSDQFGFVAKHATVLPSLMKTAFRRGAEFLWETHAQHVGGERKPLPSPTSSHWNPVAEHRSTPLDEGLLAEQLDRLLGGTFSDGPVKWLMDTVKSSRARETLILAIGFTLLVRDGAGPACRAADVHSHLSMSLGTCAWDAKTVDFCGSDAISASAINTGNANGAQPFKISVSTVRQPTDPAPVPDAANDFNLKNALKWMFAVSPLLTQALPTALVSFRLRLAEAFDSSRAWHQVYHPIAVMAALLLYMAAPGATHPRYLHVACWTYNNKLHGQILASLAELRGLVHGSDDVAALAAGTIARRLRQALGNDSPHKLVSTLRNLISAKKLSASHGLGMAHTAADENGRAVIAWPRVLGVMSAYHEG